MKNILCRRGMISMSVLIIICCCTSIDDRELCEKAMNDLGLSPPGKQAEPETVFILTDVSRSMAGFASVSSFSGFLSSLHNSLSGLEREYYEISVDTKHHDVYVDFTDINLYSGGEANFGLINDLVDSVGALIVLTDMQFNNQLYYQRMVEVLQKLIDDDKFVNISCTVTPFDGRIFTQMVERREFNSDKPRPLYAITASDKRFSAFLLDALEQSGTWEYQIPLTKRLPSKRSIRNEYKTKGENVLSMDIENDGFVHWDRIEPSDVMLNIYSTRGMDISTSPRDTKVKVESVNVHKNGRLQLEIDVSQLHQVKNQRDIMVVNVKPSHIPSWVKDMTCTTDDAPETQATKTLWLERLIQDVVRPIKNPFILTQEVTVIGDVY